MQGKTTYNRPNVALSMMTKIIFPQIDWAAKFCVLVYASTSLHEHELGHLKLTSLQFANQLLSLQLWEVTPISNSHCFHFKWGKPEWLFPLQFFNVLPSYDDFVILLSLMRSCTRKKIGICWYKEEPYPRLERKTHSKEGSFGRGPTYQPVSI